MPTVNAVHNFAENSVERRVDKKSHRPDIELSHLLSPGAQGCGKEPCQLAVLGRNYIFAKVVDKPIGWVYIWSMGSVRMYHGTTRKAAKRIVESGVLLSGSCFTPNRRAAEHFAYDGGCVVAFDVDPSEIMIDLEIGKWLDLDAANFCNGTPMILSRTTFLEAPRSPMQGTIP